VIYWPLASCRECQGLDERCEDMRDRGLTLGQAIDDAVQLVDIWGLGYCGIDASLAGGKVSAIQSTAHRASFKQSVLK
jgi:hypothetical protein